MRTLSTSTDTAVGRKLTDPAWLLEIEFFSTTARFSSRGDQTWNGQLFIGGRIISVSGLQWDASGKQAGTIMLVNSDRVISALVWNGGISRRAVRAWNFYGDNPDAADPVAVFDGMGDFAEFSPGMVALHVAGDRVLSAPRRFIRPPLVNHARPAGTRFKWQGQDYILERAQR